MSGRFDRVALDCGHRNAAAGWLVWDNLPARADKVERALCLAGFAQERIARNIGKFPVLLHAGRRRFWLVAPGVYNASGADGEAPAGAGGYPDLRALFSLKGEPQA